MIVWWPYSHRCRPRLSPNKITALGKGALCLTLVIAWACLCGRKGEYRWVKWELNLMINLQMYVCDCLILLTVRRLFNPRVKAFENGIKIESREIEIDCKMVSTLWSLKLTAELVINKDENLEEMLLLYSDESIILIYAFKTVV